MSENPNKNEHINIELLDINKLEHFKNHPFKLYEGQPLTDMIESILNNGLFSPIIVRPLEDSDDGKYEILSGHNRFEASKEAGLSSIPAIIRKGLTDDEAMLIVTETNLIQRSFKDMTHSERAVSLAIHYEAMKKKQGYRSDLINEIEEMLKPSDKDKTSAPLGRRLETREKIGSQKLSSILK